MKKIIDWSIVKKAIENHWFETNPIVSDSEMDETAICVAGEIDEFIRKTQLDKAKVTEAIPLAKVKEVIDRAEKLYGKHIEIKTLWIELKKELGLE